MLAAALLHLPRVLPLAVKGSGGAVDAFLTSRSPILPLASITIGTDRFPRRSKRSALERSNSVYFEGFFSWIFPNKIAYFGVFLGCIFLNVLKKSVRTFSHPPSALYTNVLPNCLFLKPCNK